MSVSKIEGLPLNVFDDSSPADSQFMKEIALIRSQLESVQNCDDQLVDHDGVLVCVRTCVAVFIVNQ